MYNITIFSVFIKCMKYSPIRVSDVQLRRHVEGIPYRITAIGGCHTVTVYYNQPPAYKCVFIKVNFII